MKRYTASMMELRAAMSALCFALSFCLPAFAQDSTPERDLAEELGMEFASIPAGSFLMGSPTSEYGRDHDETQHLVTVDSFELMTTEVTQATWEALTGQDVGELRDIAGSELPREFIGDDYPVYYVTWHDCQEFIDQLNSLDTEYEYRLPSEAEWEYACRAGTTTAYYWGETMRGDYCWYYENSDAALHPVGQKLPNAWGLYDMSGNVWEWCQDVYTTDYEDCPTNGTAFTGQVSKHIHRGGSWNNSPQYCRSANRGVCSTGGSGTILGLRLARSAR